MQSSAQINSKFSTYAILGVIFFIVLLDQTLNRIYFSRPDSFLGFLMMSPKEWLWFFKDTVAWTSLLSAPFFLFGGKARFMYYALLPLFILCEAIAAFAWSNFKMQLDGDWIGIVLGSSPSELELFISHYAGWRFFLATAFVLALASGAVTIAQKTKNVENSKSKTRIGYAAVIVFCILLPIFSSPSIAFKTSPVILLVSDSINNFYHYKRMAKMKKKPKIPEAISIADNLDASCYGVFILGESATRNHWSLYGYSRKTTPRIDAFKDELTVFTDLATPISNTAKAMELIFTMSTMDKPDKPICTYSQMLKEAGFYVSLYSSQSRWGRWDGTESFIFAGCEPLLFMDEENLTNPWYDDVLLKYLDKDLKSHPLDRPSVTILHLRGSHFPADAHYPSDKKPKALEDFIASQTTQNADTNTYDNSIFYTDIILGETLERLKKKGGPAWMIYLSDHGDSIGEGSWRLVNDRNVWEVPMIIWLSEDYKKKFPKIAQAVHDAAQKPLQSDQLLQGFLQIAGLKGWEIGSEKDFLSDDFKPRFPRLIEGGKLEYKWRLIQ